MDLQVELLKVDISATSKQNSLTGPYHHLQDRDKLLIPPSSGRGLRKPISNCNALSQLF